MKLKRVFLIVTAGVLFVLMCVFIYGLVNFIMLSQQMDYGFGTVSFYASVFSYFSNITVYLRRICLLALVDFLFCVGQKRYNKSMLGISVAAFALAILMLFLNSSISGLYTLFFNKLDVDVNTTVGYFCFWTALSTLPFVGLTVSYVVVKSKFLKSQYEKSEIKE